MARFPLISVLLAMIAAPLAAQVAVPGVAVPRVGQVLGQVGELAGTTLDRTAQDARELARTRLQRIDRLVRSNRATIERDARGAPARRGAGLGAWRASEGGMMSMSKV